MIYIEYEKFDHTREIFCGGCSNFKTVRGRKSNDPRIMYVCQKNNNEVDELFGYCKEFNKKMVDMPSN